MMGEDITSDVSAFTRSCNVGAALTAALPAAISFVELGTLHMDLRLIAGAVLGTTENADGLLAKEVKARDGLTFVSFNVLVKCIGNKRLTGVIG